MRAATLIRDLRRGAGLTQAELARRAGSSQAMIARYESAAVSPTVDTLRRILRAAGQELTLASRPVAEPKADLPRLLPRVRALSKQLTAEAQAAGAENLRVFGSVARGEDHSGSDVDFLVDFPAAELGLMPLLGLATRWELLLGRAVDIAAEDLLNPEIREQALAEAIAL